MWRLQRIISCIGVGVLAGAITPSAAAATVQVPLDAPTIQQAIDDCVNGDIVLVGPGTWNEQIDFLGKAITVQSTDPLDPSVVANTIIDGTGLPGSVVTFRNGEGPGSVLAGFTITGGTGTDLGDGFLRGGGVHIRIASPIVTYCVFTDNTANYGGGLLAYMSEATIDSCTFLTNSADSGGGAYNSCSNTTMVDCLFQENEAAYGAGLLNWQELPTISACQFLDNTATTDGGGIYNSHSSPTVTGTEFTGNAAKFGGGMFSSYGSPVVLESIFTGNTGCMVADPLLEPGGGGMYNWFTDIQVTDCEFRENAGCWGGGMSNQKSNPVVTGCLFEDNIAARDGGGVYNDDGMPVFDSCVFRANTAEYGGGMLSYDGCPTVSGCSFEGNNADVSGGGMYNSCGGASISSCAFIENDARYGAGMLNWTGAPTIVDAAFIGNIADDAGGGMYNSEANAQVTNCSFTGNLGGAGGFQYWEDGGGGMYNSESSPVITLCQFDENAGLYGGGMFNLFSSPTVIDTTFAYNYAHSDGGGMASFDGDPDVSGTTFIGNRAGEVEMSPGRGGGMANYLTNPAITECTFDDNWASFMGGGMFNEYAHALVLNSRFIGNEGWNVGGGMASLSSSPTILACQFTGEPGSSEYRLVDCAEPFEDISGTGTVAPTASNDDDGGDIVPLGFMFEFYGTAHTEIGISSNGYLTFGGVLGTWMNEPIPTASAPNDLIAPFWDDWNPYEAGMVHYQTLGLAPHRRFIAQWTDVQHFGGGCCSTFQAVLYETANCIEFRYGDLLYVSPTTGIENQDGTVGIDAGSPGSYSALAFSPKATNVNMSYGPGGGLYSESGSPSIINTLFTDCEAYYGGAMAFVEASPLVTNVTCAENAAMYGAAVDSWMANPILTNVILWDDLGNEITGDPATVSYSDVAGGYAGTGNIDLDPLFVNPCLDDFRLAAGSPAIDAGDSTALPPDVVVDLDGLQRFVDDPGTPDTGVGYPPVDMGAYEYQNQFCPADLDGDGQVDVTDLLALLAAWGTPDGDLTFDGTTDIQDLLVLLGAWGSCP